MREALLIIAKAFARWVWIEEQKLYIIQDNNAKVDEYNKAIQNRAVAAYTNNVKLKEDS